MTVSLTDGIASVSLSGAYVQEYSLEETEENTKTMGMVSGKAQYVHAYSFGRLNKVGVKGRGALSLSPGVGGDIGVAGISGGVILVPSVKYTEKINDTADWEFSAEHLPHAA